MSKFIDFKAQGCRFDLTTRRTCSKEPRLRVTFPLVRLQCDRSHRSHKRTSIA